MTTAAILGAVGVTVHPAAAYAAVACFTLFVLVLVDRFQPLGDAVLMALFWPLTVVVVLLLVLAVVLRRLGFDARFGRPKEGLGWSAGLCRLRPGLPPRRVIGFWVACPWRAFSVWWAGRPQPTAKELP